MRSHLRDLIIAAILALLCCLPGCSESSQGFDASLGFTLDPVGVQVRVKTLPVVTTVPATQWVLNPNARAQ